MALCFGHCGRPCYGHILRGIFIKKEDWVFTYFIFEDLLNILFLKLSRSPRVKQLTSFEQSLVVLVKSFKWNKIQLVTIEDKANIRVCVDITVGWLIIGAAMAVQWAALTGQVWRHNRHVSVVLDMLSGWQGAHIKWKFNVAWVCIFGRIVILNWCGV